MAKTLCITQGRIVIVDDDDFQVLSEYRWSYSASTGYAVRKGRKGEPRTVHMHRLVLSAPKGMQVDHVNGDKLDNRRSNLRFASAQSNAFNRKKPKGNSTSQYKGVLKRKGESKWEARIKINDKAKYLGKFSREEDAARAYDDAAVGLFGAFARVNFPIAAATRAHPEN